MKTYAVTGGAGFIGTNLCEYLTSKSYTVHVIDNLVAGKKERLPHEVILHTVDIRDGNALTEILTGVDVLVHLAALPAVQGSIDDPMTTHSVNVDGTLSVLEAARKAGVSRVVFASSAAVYGDQEKSVLVETLPPRPKSPYGLHKFQGEQLMQLWSELYGIKTVSLRFFNVYGPHLNPEGAYALVVGKFLKLIKEGRPLTVTGDGTQTRDFIHVLDIARAIETAASSEAVGCGEILNVGSGIGTSIAALAQLFGGPIEYIASRIEPKHSRADIVRIHTTLNWSPEISLETGIEALKKESRNIV